MKKKDYLKIRTEVLIGYSRHRKSLRRRDKVYNPNREYINLAGPGGFSISAPEKICIYGAAGADKDAYIETIKFIGILETNIGRKKCLVDFSKTKRATAAALLCIYASIDNANTNGGYSSGLAWSKVAPHINKVLRKLNFKLLLSKKEIEYKFKALGELPIVSSVGNKHMEEIVDFIQEKVYQGNMAPKTEHAYGDAVSETINNVRLHAYPDLEVEQKKWWLICSVIENVLYLAIYDMGIGIPKTVLDKPWFLASLEAFYPSAYEDLLESFPSLRESGLKAFIPKKIQDSQLIYLSMKGDVTGTKRTKHGQGSKSIKALVDETEDGKLWVFSNNGLYVFKENAEDEVDASFQARLKLPMKLPGTLVQWNIKLT
jgi:hypothetical protein